jgi:hypothetical protein
MPLFEYVLVALMGAAGHSAAAPGTILGPEAIAQPNGGALIAAQEPPKKEDIRRTMLKVRHNKVRHHKHRHGRRGVYTKKDTK